MKLIVCSDSHGNFRGLQELIDREHPEMVLFLGDGERDWTMVDIPRNTSFYAVSGNCDFLAMEPAERSFSLGDIKVFMTHGHRYGVKQDLHGLSIRVKEFPAELVLYGHTHQPQIDFIDGAMYVCPGSMGYHEERYAVIELEKGSAVPKASLRKL